MSGCSGKEAYQTQFHPRKYLDTYMHQEPGSIGEKFVTFYLKELAEIFNSGKVKGKTLIDIGAGPCIYQQLSACEAFEEIIVTDFTDRNREEYEKWLKNKPGAFDWSKVVKQVCKLEGDRKTWTEKEEQLRKTITKVLKCDVLKKNPVDPVVLPQADCLLSSLCLEGACMDFESYLTGLKNITNLLKPGGHLVICGAFGGSFYMVGEVLFGGLTMYEDFFRDALNEAGYDIEKLELSVRPEGYVNEKADYAAYFVAQAKKRNVYIELVFSIPLMSLFPLSVLCPGKWKGRTLIDIGSGPSIYQLLSACDHFEEIITTDYPDLNREELDKRLKNDPEAFDWSPVVKPVCELKGDRCYVHRVCTMQTPSTAYGKHPPTQCFLWEEFESSSPDSNCHIHLQANSIPDGLKMLSLEPRSNSKIHGCIGRVSDWLGADAFKMLTLRHAQNGSCGGPACKFWPRGCPSLDPPPTTLDVPVDVADPEARSADKIEALMEWAEEERMPQSSPAGGGTESSKPEVVVNVASRLEEYCYRACTLREQQGRDAGRDRLNNSHCTREVRTFCRCKQSTMADFTGGDVYQKSFNPKAYLEGYFRFGEGSLGDEFLKFALKQYADTFMPGKLKGKTLIDIGTGPTIHQLLSACEHFEEIIATDYIDRNREELEKWLKNDPEAFDWSPVIKYVCELEGDREKWLEKQERLRRVVKQVLKCDVMKSNPLEPVQLPQADCLLSAECLEAACKDQDDCRSALKNMSTLLKPGGHLVLCGVLNTNYYMVGEVKFSSLYITKDLLQEALNKEGFVIEYFKTADREGKEMQEISDFSGSYLVVACKQH
ncbi:uncharacterized protein WCC33_016640 [Rhinophrynus dorsalis]